MQLHVPSFARRASGPALVAVAIAACGGTVVFEEDGGGDGGSGGTSPIGPTGTTSAATTSGQGGFTTSSTPASSGSSNPSSVDVVSVGPGPGPGPSSSSGIPGCEGELFGPEIDECGRESCCAEMAVCQTDFSLCFSDTGELDVELPDGRAFLRCMTSAACLPPAICDTGIVFGDSDREIVELALCLSDFCCDEFRECTDFGTDVDACIDCLNGEGNFDTCTAAVECGAANCDFAVDT